MEPVLIAGMWYRLVFANEPDFPPNTQTRSALVPCTPQSTIKCMFCCDVRDSSEFDYCRCCGYGKSNC